MQFIHTFLTEHPLRISLTVSSKLHHLEISWFNVKPVEGVILVTKDEPTGPYHKYIVPPPPSVDDHYYASSTGKPNSDTESTSSSRSDQSSGDSMEVLESRASERNDVMWTYGPLNRTVQYWLEPTEPSGWITTNIPFDMESSKNISIHSKCYGFWTVYLDAYGEVKASACISAYPTWMNDMKSHIGRFKFRDLFIAGTHDSGSYRERFNPTRNETLVTKYALTQVRNGFVRLVRC